MLASIELSTGRRIAIDYDDCSESPREWCNYSRLLCIANREFSLDENLSQDELHVEHRDALERGDYVFPLFVYIHSGVVFSVSPFACRWDSGQCGIAIVPKDNADDRQQALSTVKHELDVLNTYLAGGVYNVFVQHPNGFDVETDDCLSGNYIRNEADLIDSLEGLDLTNGELNEAKARIDELMP